MGDIKIKKEFRIFLLLRGPANGLNLNLVISNLTIPISLHSVTNFGILSPMNARIYVRLSNIGVNWTFISTTKAICRKLHENVVQNLVPE